MEGKPKVETFIGGWRELQCPGLHGRLVAYESAEGLWGEKGVNSPGNRKEK